jgi:hypothetical protein
MHWLPECALVGYWNAIYQTLSIKKLRTKLYLVTQDFIAARFFLPHFPHFLHLSTEFCTTTMHDTLLSHCTFTHRLARHAIRPHRLPLS